MGHVLLSDSSCFIKKSISLLYIPAVSQNLLCWIGLQANSAWTYMHAFLSALYANTSALLLAKHARMLRRVLPRFKLVACRVTHLCFPVSKILLLTSFGFPPATKMQHSPLSDDLLDLMDCTSIPPTPEKLTNFKIPKLSSSLSSKPTPAQRPSKSSFGSKPPRSKKTKPTKPGHHHQTTITRPSLPNQATT